MAAVATSTPSITPNPSPWQPKHLRDDPAPPPPDTREDQLAALAAQEKLGHDGKRQRVRARRTVDPFGGLERWKIVSAFTKLQSLALLIVFSIGFAVQISKS